MIEFIKNSWKMVVTITGAIAIIGVLTTFYSNLATSADLDKVKEDTACTIQQLKQSIELDRNITRLNMINDSLMRAKILLKTYPKDEDLQEDIDSLKIEKEQLQRKIGGN